MKADICINTVSVMAQHVMAVFGLDKKPLHSYRHDPHLDPYQDDPIKKRKDDETDPNEHTAAENENEKHDDRSRRQRETQKDTTPHASSMYCHRNHDAPRVRIYIHAAATACVTMDKIKRQSLLRTEMLVPHQELAHGLLQHHQHVIIASEDTNINTRSRQRQRPWTADQAKDQDEATNVDYGRDGHDDSEPRFQDEPDEIHKIVASYDMNGGRDHDKTWLNYHVLLLPAKEAYAVASSLAAQGNMFIIILMIIFLYAWYRA
jgi:hypothetical protein